MKIVKGPSWREVFAMNGQGTDIADGALVAFGTVTTDSAAKTVGSIGLAAAAMTDAIGIKLGIHDFSEVGDSTPEDGDGTYVAGGVELALPGALIAAEYDLSSGLIDVASTSTTTVTITSLENNIDCGYLLAVAGTGVGKLAYIETSGSGSCVTTTATGWDATTDVIKILPRGHGLLGMTSDNVKLTSQAAAGTGVARILYSEIDTGQGGWQRLDDSTKWDNYSLPLNAAGTGLAAGVKVRSVFCLANGFFTPID